MQPAAAVRDLGLLLDRELSMKQHVIKVAAICYYHLRRLRQTRRRVGIEVTMRLVLALIMSRIDYCNSALAGLPQTTIASLQRVQNAAASLVFELGPKEHVTPIESAGGSSSSCAVQCTRSFVATRRST